VIVKVFRIIFKLRAGKEVAVNVAASDSFRAVERAVDMVEHQNLSGLYPYRREHQDNDIVAIEINKLAEGESA